MKNEYYSNCLIEAIKAKIKNPKVKLLYYPAYLNDVWCPHIAWLDEDGEHDFYFRGWLPWYKRLWHKGSIRNSHRGCYKAVMMNMIERKYYDTEDTK